MAIADDVARLADMSAKLLNEVERLRRDVRQLLGRIEPYTGEIPPPQTVEIVWQKRWKVVDALALIEGARRGIQGCEFDLNSIRSNMDAISQNVVSREDMKPFLK